MTTLSFESHMSGAYKAPSPSFDQMSGVYKASDVPSSVKLPLHPHTDFVTYMFSKLSSSRKNLQARDLIDAESGKSLSRSQIPGAISSLVERMQWIRKGEVVMILLPNSLHFPIIFNAILKLGAVATMMNPPVSTPLDIAKQLKSSKARLIFTDRAGTSKLVNCPVPVALVDEGSGDIHFPAGVETLTSATAGNKFERRIIRQSDPAALLYSSGTTGVSKGVVVTHGNFIAAMEVLSHAVDEMDNPKDVILVLFPMSSMGGLVWLACSCLLQGGPTFAFLPRYHITKTLAAIERFRVTKLIIAPPVALDLLKADTKSRDLSSFTTLISAAAPLSGETMDAVVSKYPHMRKFIQLYGMTESTTIASGGPGPLGSTGKLKPFMEAKVLDLESGKPQPPNHKGELLIRGPTIMHSYLNNVQATTEAIDEEGWLHTGDLVYFDDSGYLYIVDRLKELIKYKGYQVAPAELEAVLLTHPDIADCAVVPFPDEASGEIPLACIVRRKGKQISSKEVMDFVSYQVSPYKKIRRVIFLDSIPKSATGKILRKELKLQFVSKL